MHNCSPFPVVLFFLSELSSWTSLSSCALGMGRGGFWSPNFCTTKSAAQSEKNTTRGAHPAQSPLSIRARSALPQLPFPPLRARAAAVCAGAPTAREAAAVRAAGSEGGSARRGRGAAAPGSAAKRARPAAWRACSQSCRFRPAPLLALALRPRPCQASCPSQLRVPRLRRPAAAPPTRPRSCRSSPSLWPTRGGSPGRAGRRAAARVRASSSTCRGACS